MSGEELDAIFVCQKSAGEENKATQYIQWSSIQNPFLPIVAEMEDGEIEDEEMETDGTGTEMEDDEMEGDEMEGDEMEDD